METWVTLFESEIVPFQQSKGVLIHSSWRGETDDSVFVWMRTFESEEQREAQYAAVYGSETWDKQFRGRINELIDREQIKVLRLVPLPSSPKMPEYNK